MVYVEIFVTVNYGAGRGGCKHSKPIWLDINLLEHKFTGFNTNISLYLISVSCINPNFIVIYNTVYD